MGIGLHLLAIAGVTFFGLFMISNAIEFTGRRICDAVRDLEKTVRANTTATLQFLDRWQRAGSVSEGDIDSAWARIVKNKARYPDQI